ncbi:MAG: 3-isopropylmalate dehydratase small subunit [Chthoniobacterales bacterium]|jgi:3-isopropylmalate/(R)-2-methylmalate dehydratase small subunit|nr:3-isopropylmalate dehydratase small subunit [Chthoniobacterales bacterium]
MALAKISQLAGTGVYAPGDDVDTDRIIPARFMKCVTFDGLGEYAFYDERFHEDGKPKAHPIDNPKYAGASILLAGRNFGCGSSREHAPQALYRHGFRAVLAESFAEIFFGNSITLGMPCLVMDGRDIRALAALIDEAPQTEINIDIPGGQVSMADVSFPAKLPDHAREALVDGKWDAIADLLEGLDAVKATADKLPYMRVA